MTYTTRNDIIIRCIDFALDNLEIESNSADDDTYADDDKITDADRKPDVMAAGKDKDESGKPKTEKVAATEEKDETVAECPLGIPPSPNSLLQSYFL